MRQLSLFSSPMFGTIRTLMDKNDEPLFCLNDVCRSLELDGKQVRRRLDKGVVSKHPLLTEGGVQELTFVNEDGLYDVILDSRKPEAKAFRKWVTSEVLPTIRKTGGYIATRNDDTPEMIMARALNVANHIIAEHEKKISRLEEQLDVLEEQTAYSRLIESAPGDVNINQIALDYGWSAIVMNRKLHELRIQYYQGGQWILYAKYKGNGYVNSETIICDDGKARIHTKWTQRGRRFIYNELRKELILPLCERY